MGTLEGLTSQNQTQMKLFFLDIETAIKNKLDIILKKLSQRHNGGEHASFDMKQGDCDKEFLYLNSILADA